MLEGNGRIFERQDGKCLVYLPVSVVRDSQFSLLADTDSKTVQVEFKPDSEELVISEEE